MPQERFVSARTTMDPIAELTTVEEIVADSANELQDLLRTFDSGKSDGRVPGEAIRSDNLPPRWMRNEVLNRRSKIRVEPRCVDIERLAETVPVCSCPIEVTTYETRSFQSELKSRECQEELEQ